MTYFFQLCLYLVAVIGVLAQDLPPSPPPESSWPQDYPEKPKGDYSPAWQNCECINQNMCQDQTEEFAQKITKSQRCPRLCRTLVETGQAASALIDPISQTTHSSFGALKALMAA
jgi:hypothetical protein